MPCDGAALGILENLSHGVKQGQKGTGSFGHDQALQVFLHPLFNPEPPKGRIGSFPLVFAVIDKLSCHLVKVLLIIGH